MSIWNSIANIFQGNSVSKPNQLVTEKNGEFSFKLRGERSFNFQMGIDTLDNAIRQAEDIEHPSRIELYNVYKNLKDLHVKSQIRTAIFKVVSQPWVIVDESGEVNGELTDLFKKKWFTQLNEHIISTEFWGHTLIYFNTNVETGEIKESKVFPRIHVNPEKNSILPDLGNPELMFNYLEVEEFKDLFIEVKDTETLGLLKDIARYSILKGYAINDWARSSEKWGDPHVILKSASQSDEEDDRKEGFLKGFGNNGYAIVDKDDEIELLERGSAGSSHSIFLDLIKMNNDENSLGINGQTATSHEKSFVGAAEVQERILNDYTLARLRDLMYFHNETTLPFLAEKFGEDSPYASLKGHTWMPVAFLDTEEDTTEEETIKDEEPEEDPVEDPKPLDPAELENILKNPFI